MDSHIHPEITGIKQRSKYLALDILKLFLDDSSVIKCYT